MKPSIRNYGEAAAYLGGKRSRPVEYMTRVIREGMNIVIRHHNTNIVTYHPDGSATLTSGGWRTPTTKDRLNRYGGLHLYQQQGTWWIDREEGKAFADGMVVRADGSWEGYEEVWASKAKAKARLRARARAYAEAFFVELVGGRVPQPSAGDCWGCCMVAEDGRHPMGGSDHVLSHMEEFYYVPSLLVNAIKRYPVSIMAKDFIAGCMAGKATGVEWEKSIAHQQITSSIYRWVCAELGFAS